ncbi:hypothetical protein ACJW30_05G104100 [Castanea mollissima]
MQAVAIPCYPVNIFRNFFFLLSLIFFEEGKIETKQKAKNKKQNKQSRSSQVTELFTPKNMTRQRFIVLYNLMLSLPLCKTDIDQGINKSISMLVMALRQALKTI